MRMENRHLLQRKLGTCLGKELRVKIKGAHIRGGKERGVLLKINRGTYQSNMGTFYVKRGASYKVKGALFPWKKGALVGYLKNWGHCAPPAPPPPGPPPLYSRSHRL